MPEVLSGDDPAHPHRPVGYLYLPFWDGRIGTRPEAGGRVHPMVG